MTKIKVYRGIGADTKEELDKYIKEFYDKNIKAQGYSGGGNLGNGIYFTTNKGEAIAYSKANDYKEWNYSHVFEVEIDTDDFLPTDKIDDDKLLELDNEYKQLDAIMKSGYYNDDTYSQWIKAQDRALEKYVKLQNKKGVTSDNIFNIQDKKAIFDIPNVKNTVKSTNYWDKRAIERMTTAEKQSEAYISRIKEMYNQAFKNIDEEIARVYKNYSKETGLDVQKLKELLTRSETQKTWEQMKRQGLDKYIKNNYKSRISKLEQIQAQIYAKTKQIYPKEELEQTMCYKGVINDSYYKAIYDTQMGTGYDFSFNKIDNNLTNALLNEKWSGKNYSERIWGNTDILADSLSQVLGGALLSGQSIEKTTKQIKDRFNVSKYYSERLVRTETNHFNNEADARAYEEMGINQYVFIATLDSRTSKKCQSMDNKVFAYKDKEVGVNFPPLHPNCRSKTRGYLGEEIEKTLKRRARNPITGQTEIIDNMSYKDWIKRYGLGANNLNNSLEKHPKPKYLGNINIKNSKEIDKVLNNYEKLIKNDTIENAIVITKRGEVYKCFGNANNVWVDVDLGDKLKDAIVTHNHPKDETYFGFSPQDINLFEKYNLKILRGVDYKYTYELNQNKSTVLPMPTFVDENIGYEHLRSIQYAIEKDIYYMRWKNDKK